MLFREKRQIAICAATAVMICGFVLLRYLPLQKRMKSLRQAHKTQMLAISRASSESKQIPIIREQLLRLRTEVENYELQVPTQRELGEFLQRITNLMNEHNLQEQMIQPGKEIKAGELHCIPVIMQCKGKLSQIFEFYKHVQSLDRLIRIEHVKLVNDSGFRGKIIMHTEAVIYYRTEFRQGWEKVNRKS